MIRSGLVPERKAMPISAAATQETIGLYRWLKTARRHKRYALGVADMLVGMPDTSPTGGPQDYNTPQIFFDQTGRWPGYYSVEYHDPDWTSRWGSEGTDFLRARIISMANRGAIISLHNHWGNPATGQLSRSTVSWSGSSTTTGNWGDRNGSPLAAIKTGGAQEGQLLAYLDRLATFINSLVDAKGRKIPVIYRPMHELGTGTWFWWNGSDRAADAILVWQKIVSYLRDVKGLTNVLYCWNVNRQSSINFFPWWPGTANLDIVSIDQYDNRDVATINIDGANTDMEQCWAFLEDYTSVSDKPLAVAEFGYQYTSTRGSNDLWHVRTANRLNTRYSKAGFIGLWPQPYGPAAADPTATKLSLKAWADSPNALTADKLSGVFK